MGERKKHIWKLAVILPVVLILIFLCWPREKGNTEGAIFRNIVRETLMPPMALDICHIEDIDFPEGRFRAVIFESKLNAPFYNIHWYQQNEDGDYILLWGDEGGIGSKMCEEVYTFTSLLMKDSPVRYDIYYVNDPVVKEVVIQYIFGAEGKQIQTEYASVAVEKTPQLLCLPSYDDLYFAPDVLKQADSMSCGTDLSALDEEGNVLSGAVTKEEIDLHNIYKIEMY